MSTEKYTDAFVVSAPTRADLCGGTLDLWPLYCLFGSAKTINVALDLKAVCSFHVTPHSVPRFEIHLKGRDPFLFYAPMQGDDLANVAKEVRFPVSVVSRYLLSRETIPGISLKIEIETQAPMGSGLGGSSALCVSLVRGLGRVFGDFQEQGWQWKMLDWVRDAEAEYLRTPTGTQDYLAALFGSLSCFTYEVGGVSYQAYDKALAKNLDEHLLVLFSGEMHHSGMSNWELYKKALEGDAMVLSGLRSIRDLSEVLDRDLRSSDVSWKRMGQHLNEEWRIRKATFNVHTQRLDEIVDFLQSQKVFGVKVCGAAQGGSLIAFVDPKLKAKIMESCRQEGIQVLNSKVASAGVTFTTLS